MSDIRTFRAVAAVVAAAAVIMTASCSSTTETGGSTPINASEDVSALLGPKNEATGSTIKIGLVDDGKSPGIDHTPIIASFNASVQYANEHLGGINGHKIEVVECSTNNTPSDATGCGIKMANEKVAAVLVPVSARDADVFNALKDSGIPYMTYAAGAQDIIIGKDAYLLVNPIATLAAPAKIAKENNVKKAGIIIIDVPAATGPLEAIARPIYAKAGVDLSVIPISPQTADMTPQIQEAISKGIEQFSVIGTDEFNAQGIKTLKQLGFTGKVVMVTAPSPALAEQAGGLDGVIYITSATSDPADKDVQLYNAVMKTYLKDVTPNAQSAWSFALVTGLVNALKGNDKAVDSTTVNAALGSMPNPLPLPLGAGLTFQCGAKLVALLPNACTDNALWTTLDEQGNGKTYEKLDVAQYMPGAA